MVKVSGRGPGIFSIEDISRGSGGSDFKGSRGGVVVSVEEEVDFRC